MSSQRETRNGEQSRRSQNEKWRTEIVELEGKPKRSEKEDKRLAVLQQRIQGVGPTANEDLAPDQSVPSLGVEDGTYTSPSESKISKTEKPSGRETFTGANNKASESERQKSPSTEEGDLGNNSSAQAQNLERADKYRFAEAYCRSQSFAGKSRIIWGYGIRGNAKYEIGTSEAHKQGDLEKLPFISGKEESIFDLLQGNGDWLYGFVNIEAVVNVASLKSAPERGWRTTKNGKVIHVFPTTMVKIKWIDIQESHLRMLQNGENWNLRSKLMGRLKKKDKETLDDWIREAALRQDEGYEIWFKDNNVSGEKRSSTFFPDEKWATEKPPPAIIKRAERRSERIKTKTTHKNAQPNETSGNGDGFSSKKRQRSDSAVEQNRTKKPRSVLKPAGELPDSGDDRFSGKKRPRSDSTADPDSIKKPRFIPEPADEYIDYDSYMCTNMNHFKLDEKRLNEDREGYMKTLREIKAGWDEYVKIMKGRGFKIAPEGGKPEDY